MIYLLTFVFFVLQCLDWYTTRTILKAGGYEQNPLMVPLFKLFGVDIAMGLKTVILTYLYYWLGSQKIVVELWDFINKFFGLPLNYSIDIIPVLLVLLVADYVWVVKHNWKSL